MPKQTFLNLPEQKREMIMNVAIEEFAENLYSNASVSKIVEKAGISKGSMYQYFSDKKDLYKYILEIMGIKKMEYLKEFVLKKDEIEFIELIRLLYKKGLEFAIENPLLARIGNNFLKEQDNSVKDEISKDNQDKSSLFFIGLIENAKNKGEISSEINSEIGADIIYYFNNILMDRLMDTMKQQQTFGKHDEEFKKEYFKKVDEMLLILEKGLIVPKERRI